LSYRHLCPPDSLRFRLNAITVIVSALLSLTFAWQQIQTTRASVREEIIAGNRIATQLLERASWIVMRSGPEAMLSFLEQLGRVRANDITFTDSTGQLRYRSPQPTYKQGRSAPAWFAALVLPPLQRQVIDLPGAGQLTIEADASRAILDGWDDLTHLAALALLALVAVSVCLFWLVGRLVRPLAQVEQALARLERGDYTTRLPNLPGREARLIGAAVNRLGDTIEANLAARMQAFEAERSLAVSREWAQKVEARLEAERKDIAAALHDELGQSVTAIRSLARSVGARLPEADASGRQAATMIDEEAARLYDAMHGMIPRLTPLALGSFGLAEALTDLAAGIRQRHPHISLHTELAPDPATPPNQAVLLAAYRVAQEAITNALKHSGGTQLHLRLVWLPLGLNQGQPPQLQISVEDDGIGLPPPELRPARFGLMGLRERVLALGGEFSAQRLPARGSLVQALLPLNAPESARNLHELA
jgi:two-component system sensor histidine kinase UhpB